MSCISEVVCNVGPVLIYDKASSSHILIRFQDRGLLRHRPTSNASGGVPIGAGVGRGCAAPGVLPRGFRLAAPCRVGRGLQLAQRAAAHVGAGAHGHGGRGRARHPQLRRHQVGARRSRRALQAPHGFRPPRHPGKSDVFLTNRARKTVSFFFPYNLVRCVYKLDACPCY